MKKGTLDLSNYIIGLALVIGILVTWSSFYFSSAKKYGIEQSSMDEASNFNATYNKLSTITSLTDTANTQLLGSTTSDEATATTFYGKMISIAKGIYNTISLPSAMINDMVVRFHAPAIWGNIVVAILIISLITGFVYLIFQKG